MASLDIPGMIRARVVVSYLLQKPDIVIIVVLVALIVYAAFVLVVVVELVRIL
jgi:hypothetical protein